MRLHSRLHRAWAADFFELISATTRRWAANVNGGRVTLGLVTLTVLPGVGFKMATAMAKPGESLPSWGLVCERLTLYALILTGAWIVISLFVALVQVWGEQSYKLRRTESELNEERESKIPKLTICIESLTVQAASDRQATARPLVLATVSIANDGHRSVASKWEMVIAKKDQEQTVLEVKLGPWRYVEEFPSLDWSASPLRAREVVAYDEEQYIGTISAKPIERGERPTGFFLGQILEDSVSLEDLQSIRLRCEDFSGHSSCATLDDVNIHFGVISFGRKNQGAFPPYGFKELPAHTDPV